MDQVENILFVVIFIVFILQEYQMYLLRNHIQLVKKIMDAKLDVLAFENNLKPIPPVVREVTNDSSR